MNIDNGVNTWLSKPGEKGIALNSWLTSLCDYLHGFSDIIMKPPYSFPVRTFQFSAWMVLLLSSGQASRVVQVAERLSRVPIVPPLESLKQIGNILADGDEQNRRILGESFRSPLTTPYLFVYRFIYSRCTIVLIKL